MSRVAITGAAGQLGRQLVDAFERAGHEVRGLTHADVDLAEPTSLDAMRAWRPDVVVNAAAWTDVDGCARDPERAMRINGDGAGHAARVAADAGALAVQISTNEVFDGRSDRAYRPDDAPNPVNPYGASKLAGERAVAEATRNHLIVRTAWLFGPGGSNFVTKIVAAAERARAAGDPLRVVQDEVGNPTWTPDLAAAVVGLVERRQTGVVHAAGTPPASRLAWARVVLEASASDVSLEPVALASFRRASTPPARAVLEPSDGVPPMPWEPVTRSYAAAVTATAGT